MAETDIRKFNFVFRYTVQPVDMTNFQKWIFNTVNGTSEGAYGKAVLTGFKVAPQSLLTVRTGPGIAINASGQLMVSGADVDSTFASPTGDPAKSLLVARPLLIAATPTPLPTNPLDSFDLHTIQGFELVVLDGTPAPTPVFPAPAAGDVVLMGVDLEAAAAVITAAKFNVGQRDEMKPRRNNVAIKLVDFTIVARDNILECDASSGAITATLPPAADALGQQYTIVKVDSGSNFVTVDGSGTETISGSLTLDIEAQWGSVVVYSNGTNWRVIS